MLTIQPSKHSDRLQKALQLAVTEDLERVAHAPQPDPSGGSTATGPSGRRLAQSPASCGCWQRDGHRFESPQLHQVVGASRPGFPAPTIPPPSSASA
jgi:hypothetical protein